jgi:hypothetical protein
MGSCVLIRLVLFVLILTALLPLSAQPSSLDIPEPGKPNATAIRDLETEALYDSLRAESDRYWLSRNLYPLIFSEDSADSELKVPEADFQKWRGKYIRSIGISVSSAMSSDPAKSPRSLHNLLAWGGKKLHINTREWVIRENLFFEVGDRLNPETVIFNLNYLRKLIYLNQCKISVVSSKMAPDSVDVFLDIKDNFSIKLGGAYSSQSKMNLNIEDQNFLGLGRRLRTEWHLDTEARPALGFKLNYTIPNIRRSHVDTELAWAELPLYSAKSMIVNRPFLYPIIRIAGGADIAKSKFIAPYDSLWINQLKLGAWYGHAFAGKPDPANPYAYAALSLDQVWYARRPEVGPMIGRYWHESLMVTTAIAFTRSEYSYLPYVYTVLVDDAIPVGYLTEFLLGAEHSEFRNRGFIGLRGSRGLTVGDKGFLHIRSGIESYFSNSGAEQGVLFVEPLYISPLQSAGSLRGRAILRGRVILGHERFPQESVKLSTDPYFKGNRDLSGTSLFAMGIEEDVVLPWNLAGFRFSVFGFVNTALVKDASSSPSSESQLITQGLGLRVRNPYLLWNSIELHGEWNQGAGQQRSFEILLSTKVPIKMLDFEGVRPRPYLFE